MAKFRLVTTERYKHRPDGEIMLERRPHIIGTSDEASEFIVKARTDNRCFRRVIGPLSLGGLGETDVAGEWVPSLRYKPVEMQGPDFEAEMALLIAKLESCLDYYKRTRLVRMLVEVEMTPDELEAASENIHSWGVASAAGKFIGDIYSYSEID